MTTRFAPASSPAMDYTPTPPELWVENDGLFFHRGLAYDTARRWRMSTMDRLDHITQIDGAWVRLDTIEHAFKNGALIASGALLNGTDRVTIKIAAGETITARARLLGTPQSWHGQRSLDEIYGTFADTYELPRAEANYHRAAREAAEQAMRPSDTQAPLLTEREVIDYCVDAASATLARTTSSQTAEVVDVTDDPTYNYSWDRCVLTDGVRFYGPSRYVRPSEDLDTLVNTDDIRFGDGLDLLAAHTITAYAAHHGVRGVTSDGSKAYRTFTYRAGQTLPGLTVRDRITHADGTDVTRDTAQRVLALSERAHRFADLYSTPVHDIAAAEIRRVCDLETAESLA